MGNQTLPDLSSVLTLLLGWLLGLFGPIINDQIKNKRRYKKIKKGILSELNEERYRLVCTIFLLESRLGTYDRKLLGWASHILMNYKGANQDKELSERIARLLALSEDELAQAAKLFRAKPGGALSVKKIRIPYTDSRINELEMFDEESRSLIIDVSNRFALFNEEVEEARFYFKLTYTPGLTPENHKLASQGVFKSYSNLANAAHVIVEQINRLIPN